MRTANPSTTHDYAGIAAWSFKLSGEFHSYADCEAYDRGEHRFEALSGYLWREYEIGAHFYWAIRLYDTEIIRYYDDGRTFSVDNGGHATPTTSYRLGAVLPSGFRAYHFSTKWVKGMLGLIHGDATWAQRRKVQAPGTLWPLDHSVRIDAETGAIR